MSRRLPRAADVVPHAPPILALDELIAWEPGRIEARAVVQETDPFVRDGAADAVAALEYMAQAVAACLGCEAYYAGEGVRVGMVVACREMTLERASFPVGSELLLEARRVRGDADLSHFETTARDESGEVVARATMTLIHARAPVEE